MKIKYTIPVTRDMGNCQIIGTSHATETARESALWEYNSMRAHDGLRPVSNLPVGTTSEVIEEE